LQKSLEKYFDFYNQERFHQSLSYQTPDKVYLQKRHKLSTFPQLINKRKKEAKKENFTTTIVKRLSKLLGTP
jgi:hypothetical protein